MDKNYQKSQPYDFYRIILLGIPIIKLLTNKVIIIITIKLENGSERACGGISVNLRAKLRRD